MTVFASLGKSCRLKKIRLLLAVLLFCCTCLVFLDINGVLPPWIYDGGVYLQFMPSLVQSLHSFGLAGAGFVFVLLLTLFVGRLYCSTICPLGIMMDIICFLRRKFGGKPRRRYRTPQTLVRWFFLGGTLLFFMSGTMLLVNLLDPFSIFGRIAIAIFRPLVIIGNNCMVWVLESFGSYALPPFQFNGVQLGMLVFSTMFAGFIVWIALTRDRLYCNMICPVGTLLGFFSRTAIFRISINEDLCNSCGNCQKHCGSDCIDAINKIIDYSRCVACFNCIDACPGGAVSFRSGIKGKEQLASNEEPDGSRRRFLVSIGILTALLPRTAHGQTPIKITVPNKIKIPARPHPILPPGARGLDHYIHSCTACHACVGRCPSQVLQPSLFGYGAAGLFMPHLDPEAGFCNLNCNLCSEICPSGAITPFTLEEKKRIQVGVAEFVRDNCIVVLQGTACAACSEHCPTKAVDMVSEGKLKVPKMDQDICIGCGACEHVCPAKPNKAIYVKPHSIHLVAKDPEIKNVGKDKETEGIMDFPF